MQQDNQRDWFPTEDESPDPIGAAQRGMKTASAKRFYARAQAEERDGVFVLALDGRPARTPGRNLLALPTRGLGDAVAAEWAAQGDEIDPTTMPLTRLANSAIDGVAPRRQAVVDDLVKYAGSDLTCYRADAPERLVAEQGRAWDPVLDWARDALGARFILAEGVMHVAQSDQALAAVRAAVEREASPFRLAALHVMTTLTGSVLIPLAHAAGALGVEEAWSAAHADERYQESVWGQDEEAMIRRERRLADFRAAARTLALTGPHPKPNLDDRRRAPLFPGRAGPC